MRVALVEHERADELAVVARDAECARLVAEVAEQPVRGTLQRGARDDRGDREDLGAARGDRLAHAGHGEDRVDRDERVRRCDHDPRPRRDGVEHAGGRASGVGADELDARDVDVVATRDEVLLEPEPLAGAGGDERRDRVVGHRQQRDADAVDATRAPR